MHIWGTVTGAAVSTMLVMILVRGWGGGGQLIGKKEMFILVFIKV